MILDALKQDDWLDADKPESWSDVRKLMKLLAAWVQVD